MLRAFAILAILSCSGAIGSAQTKEETMDFIVQELQAAETGNYVVKEVKFTNNGSTILYKTLIPGNRERIMEINLKDVNIFMKTIRDIKDNKDVKLNRDMQFCNLMIESRGKKSGFKINGQTPPQPKKILENILNDRKVKELEIAFNHLISLVSERKPIVFDK